MVNIRKFTGVSFHDLRQLVDRSMLTAQAADLLTACVKARLSIVVAGAPGSGKTTLLSCCAAELDPSLRVVVAEEVFERSEEHTSELQSLMRISYAVFCLKKKK